MTPKDGGASLAASGPLASNRLIRRSSVTDVEIFHFPETFARVLLLKTHSKSCSFRHVDSSFIPQVLIFLFLPCLITSYKKKKKRKKPDLTSAELDIHAPPRTEAEAPMRNDGVIYRTLCSTLQLIQSDFFQMNALLIGRSASCRAGQRAAVATPESFQCHYRGINS